MAPTPKTPAQLAPEDLKNQPVQLALLILLEEIKRKCLSMKTR
jgi:hypothetical protein